MDFTTGGNTARLTITSAGNVGINESSPSAQLVVKATTDDNPALQLFRASTGGDIASINWQTNAGSQAKINYRGAAGANEGMQFYTAGGSSSELRMIIDHSGRMGLGTNDPTSLLHLSGSAPRITLTDTAGTDDYAKIFSTGGILYLQQRDSSAHGKIIFRTENNSTAVERLRIETDGTLVKYYNGSTIQAAFPGSGQVNGITALPSYVATPFVVGKDTGSGRSAIFAGKVGIGSEGPGHPLDVFGNIRSHQTTPALYLQTLGNATGSAVIRFGDAASFQIGSIQYDLSLIHISEPTRPY